MGITKIEWAEYTWNPVTGCSKISPGCAHCYAERMARRLAGRGGYPEAPHHFDVTVHASKLGEPLRWKKPRRIFVCSMGDLFHDDVYYTEQQAIWGIMKACPQHTFMILTKRPELMKFRIERYILPLFGTLPNVWLGVTAENQEWADKRIPVLLECSSPVRFVSVEPMLGSVDIDRAMYGTGPRHGMNAFGFTDGFGYEACIQWVICGAETGPSARYVPTTIMQDLRDQCVAANVPFFFKKSSTGLHTLEGKKWEQWPQVVSNSVS